MTEHGDSHSDDELQKNAVAKKAAEAEKKAKEKALEDDQRNEGGPPPAYTGDHTSLMPLTSGRAIFEAFYLAFIKPYYLWTTATQYPFLAAYPRPENWSVKQTKVDDDGIPILNSAGEPLEEYQNEYRRRWYPRAHFVSQARYDQYEQGIIDSGESMYIALWAIHVRQSRWEDPAVEAILANDRFWYQRYLTDLPPLDHDEDGDDQSGTHTDDRTSLMPLTSGRAIFEAFYLAFIKPYYLWTTATQYPFLAAYPRPENWSVKQTKVDDDGIPILNSAGEPLEEYQNEYRRRWYPRAHFVSQARYDQYEQGIIDSGESMYIALWAIHVRQSRWGDPAVEAIVANDSFWYRRYLSDLRDDDEESGSVVTTSDGSTPPSSPGLASVEA